MPLSPAQHQTLRALVGALVDQHRAKVLVEPNRRASGFWFGGGNAAQAADGTLWLCGRYRNAGDSRLGLEAGERGLSCALFVSRDGGRSFTKVRQWSKAELSLPSAHVISIEGTALWQGPDGTWEFYVSSEKACEYPPGLESYRKPGCGVWSIDVLSGPAPDDLPTGSLRSAFKEPADAAYLHAKDPVVYGLPGQSTALVFCTHPYCWSSANTSLAMRGPASTDFRLASRQLVGRGPAWDVAGTRLTCRLPVPRLGQFADGPSVSLWFYDGLECVRQHEQSQRGVVRPRGYSCEELGGALAGFDEEFPSLERLSYLAPLFVSPHGTGCSRYVDVIATPEGLLATWQQSQDDLSQPLVGHLLPMADVKALLA